MSLSYLQNGQTINVSELPDGLIAVFTAPTDSDFSATQLPYLDRLQAQCQELGIQVLFVAPIGQSSQSPYYVSDSDKQFVELADRISNKSKPGINLIMVSKSGSELTYLDCKESPEKEYNWIEVILQFAKNYKDTNPDDGGYWKWGQVVQEAGDYLCKDCGYIGYFEVGSVFPICEVCLDGEPSGPAGPGDGFWERV